MADEYVIVNKSDLTSMADCVRSTTGDTDSISIIDLSANVVNAIYAGVTPQDMMFMEKEFNIATKRTSGTYTIFSQDELNNAGFFKKKDGSNVLNLYQVFDNVVVILRNIGTSFQTYHCVYATAETQSKWNVGATNGYKSYNQVTVYHKKSSTSISMLVNKQRALSNIQNAINISPSTVNFGTSTTCGLYGDYKCTIIAYGRN